MGLTHILTLVILFAGNSSPGSGTGATTVVAEYTTEAKCKAALELHRLAMAKGQIVIANCTAK